MVTPFARRLAAGAENQYNLYHFDSEADPALSAQIRRYWTQLGLAFPGVSTPWSAVFVSWNVMKAGATAAEFTFAPQHSTFVHHAIADFKATTGVFWWQPVASYAPKVGDIIQNNRGGAAFDYAYASSHASYASHSAVVIEVGVDSKGRYALTVGGNESDSVRRKVVRLKPNGLIVQRKIDPYICVVENRK